MSMILMGCRFNFLRIAYVQSRIEILLQGEGTDDCVVGNAIRLQIVATKFGEDLGRIL
jgi:hypothetical protein